MALDPSHTSEIIAWILFLISVPDHGTDPNLHIALSDQLEHGGVMLRKLGEWGDLNDQSLRRRRKILSHASAE